ncbi:MAG: hypothetical protein IKD68_01320 [Solobacterium sp.]|nr:hypothetical protein [Solobacterium sp.]
MDEQKEKAFVQTFIRKNRRDRLLHELGTPSKRYRGISRFCHQAEELLDPAKTVMRGTGIETEPEFERFFKAHQKELCYLLSPYTFPDEIILPLPEAVQEALHCPDAVILFSDSFAMVFEEPMKNGRMKYLLTA